MATQIRSKQPAAAPPSPSASRRRDVTVIQDCGTPSVVAKAACNDATTPAARYTDGGAGENGTEIVRRRLAPRLCVARAVGVTPPQPAAPLQDGDGDGEALAARDGDTPD